MIYEAMLAGVQFRPAAAKSVVKFIKPDERLILQRQPDNPYDINAIQVIHPESEEFIGFVNKAMAAELAMELDDKVPYECVVIHNNGWKEFHIIIRTEDDCIEPEAYPQPIISRLDDEIPF